MFRFFLSVLLCFSANAFAQTVSGTVTGEDQNALPAVLVFNLNTELKTYTDAVGKFVIAANPNDELRFVRKGFERSSKVIKSADIVNSFNIVLNRVAAEIEEVQVSKINLTGDLNTDSRNLTKVDRIAQVQRAVGVPGPPEKPREKPADFKKDVLYSLLSLSVQPHAIYDLISGDARRMKTEYRYEDLQDKIAWLRERLSDDCFNEMGIPPEKISAFLQFSLAAQPEFSQAVKKQNLSKALYLLEETLPKFLNR